ncbi:hypothetical protein ADK57_33205 [Streptomyces sp. MMG1533]|nr:hypothetical protein ADK57_33205 [Streptomyces sp. MMG1533]
MTAGRFSRSVATWAATSSSLVQVGHGLDLLVHRDRPVDPLADNPLRTVRRPLPRPGARVERCVLDRRPPLVLVHGRREDAVNGER